MKRLNRKWMIINLIVAAVVYPSRTDKPGLPATDDFFGAMDGTGMFPSFQEGSSTNWPTSEDAKMPGTRQDAEEEEELEGDRPGSCRKRRRMPPGDGREHEPPVGGTHGRPELQQDEQQQLPAAAD